MRAGNNKLHAFDKAASALLESQRAPKGKAPKPSAPPESSPTIRPTVMRSTREIGGGRTEVVWLPGVRNEKGELIAWVPLGMKEDRARQVADEMVAERKAGAR